MDVATFPRSENAFLPSKALVDAFIRSPRGTGRLAWAEWFLNAWRISRDSATIRLQRVVEDALLHTFYRFSYGHRLELTPYVEVQLSVQIEKRLGLPEGMSRICLACDVLKELHAMVADGTSLLIDGARLVSCAGQLVIEPCPEIQSKPVWMPELMRRLKTGTAQPA